MTDVLVWFLAVWSICAGLAALIFGCGLLLAHLDAVADSGLYPCARCGDPDCALYNGGLCFACFYDDEHPDEVVFEGDLVAEVEEYLEDHT